MVPRLERLPPEPLPNPFGDPTQYHPPSLQGMQKDALDRWSALSMCGKMLIKKSMLLELQKQIKNIRKGELEYKHREDHD